jgi:hypothetical protein
MHAHGVLGQSASGAIKDANIMVDDTENKKNNPMEDDVPEDDSIGSMNNSDIEKLLNKKRPAVGDGLNKNNKNKDKEDGARDDRARLDDEWKKFNEHKETLMKMMENMGSIMKNNNFGSGNGTMRYHTAPAMAGGWTETAGHASGTTRFDEDTDVNTEGWGQQPPVWGPLSPAWGHPVAPPQVTPMTVKQEGWGPTQQGWGPPPPAWASQHNPYVAGSVTDKKEKKRERERRKREDKAGQEQRRIEQENAQSKCLSALSSHVLKVERLRSRLSKKDGGETKERKMVEKVEKWKVIKHSIKLNEPVKVLIQFGKNKPEWTSLEEVWEPENITTYVPAWREYCELKTLPVNWGGTQVDSLVKEGSIEGEKCDSTVEQDGKLKEPTTEEADSDEDEDAEPAVCYGHGIDSRGVVSMKLRWKDKEDDGSCIESYGEVKVIMNSRHERKYLGRTWLQYCDLNGFLEDSFRMMGVSVVKTIEGHDWANCGRPLARIAWRHGEVTTVLVKDAMEQKSRDNNGFKSAWKEYCDKIGGVDDAFRHGHVDKEHRILSNKSNKKARHSK